MDRNNVQTLEACEVTERSGIAVLPFASTMSEAWDRFVLGHPAGSMFHLTAWKNALEQTFSYESRYLYAQKDGRITGVAPVFLIRNWIIGRALISVPMAVYGGICALDEPSVAALGAELQEMGTEEGVDFIDLRNRSGSLVPGFVSPKSIYVTFSTSLDPNHDVNLKRLPRDTRYMIRKGEKAGLEVRHGLEQLSQFYRLHAISLRRLGTPVFPKPLFQNLIAEFKGRADLMMVYAGSLPVSGVLSFFHRDTILPYYAGAAPEAGKLAANNFMYWQLMKFAVEKGFRKFDFGRSKLGTGSYAFKTQWNMQAESLPYQLALIKRKSAPNFSPANPKFQVAARVWSHVPLPATLIAGPRIVRWFP